MSKTHPIIDMTTAGWSPSLPYDQLPLLPPMAELETRDVLKRCVTARASLAELKQAAQLIPNQEILINTLPLLEARASSEIENVVTTADEMFRALDSPGSADSATREALIAGFRELGGRPLGTRMAELVATTVNSPRRSRRGFGRNT